MITLIAAIAICTPDQQTPGAVLSQMLAKYSAAKTLSGTILLTQGSEQESGQISTSLQYERPAKLYLRQEKKTADRRTWLITSDGKHFSYDKPNQASDYGAGRLVEAIVSAAGTLKLGDIYAVGAGKSLPDRSAPLDIAIGRREDLEFIRGQWANLSTEPARELDGRTVNSIVGDWREYGTAAITGRFQFLITPEGEMKRYTIVEKIVINGNIVTITSRWDIDLKIDGPVDPKLFKVVL